MIVPDDVARACVDVALDLDQGEYLLGENLLLHYRVVNRGTGPVPIHLGGDYRGSPRALRFKAIAVAEDGSQVEDPYPSVMNMGGMGDEWTLKPGEEFWASLPLMRYCDFRTAGTYRVRVYHDLGWDGDPWDHNRMMKNALPEGEHAAPIAETTIRLAMPTAEQARQVVDRALALPADGNATFGKRTSPYRDATTLRFPVYLPRLEELAQQGNDVGLIALDATVTPKATEALIRLLDDPDPAVATRALASILERLPNTAIRHEPDNSAHERIVRRAWRDRYRTDVLPRAWDLFQEDDRQALIHGAEIVRCLGRPSDLPALLDVLDRVLVELKDDPVEQSQYPRPFHACGPLILAGGALIERGAEVPVDLNRPGAAALYVMALGQNEEFRPENWESNAEGLLSHPIPYLRALTLQNIPRPVPEGMFDGIAELIGDEHEAVQAAACGLAGSTGSRRFADTLVEELGDTGDPWIVRAAHNAAVKCQVPRDRVVELCIERLTDDDLGQTFFDLIVAIVENDGYGYSQVPPETFRTLQPRWETFLRANRERVRSGPRFEPGEPPLVPDLFPRGFSFQRSGKPAWPDWDS